MPLVTLPRCGSAVSVSRAAPLLLFALLTACASAPIAPVRLASVEVENRTPEALRVSVRGRVEGLIEPGTRLRVRHLSPGPATVLAVGEGEGAARHEKAATLKAGENTIIALLPDLDREPLPEVAPLGSLLIENPEKADLDLTLYTPEGRLVARGRVFANAARRFVDLPSGTLALEARPEPAGATTREEVVVVPEDAGETTWRYAAIGARLVIVNTTDEALEVALDGASRGRVAAGGTLELVEAPGTRALTARSVPSLRPYEEVVTLSGDQEARWEVKSGRARLIIDNRSGEAISVWTRARGSTFPEQGRPLEAGALLDLGEVEPGIHEVSAIGARSQLAYAGLVEVGASQAGTFVVGPVSGTVRVDNRTRAALWLYVAELDGPERKVGEVPAGAVVLVKDLARGPVSLRALRPPSSLGQDLITEGSGATGLDLAASRLYTSRQDLAGTPAATWVIGERVGSVRIDNQRDEPVEAFADGARLGEVPARSARVFSGVPAGARRIDTVGRTSGDAQAESVALPEDGLVAVSVVAITGFLEVENGTSEPLVPRGILAAQAERVEPGQVARFRVKAGPIQAVLTGAETGYRYGQALMVPPGGEARFVAHVAPGSLIVWSRLAESVAVTLGEVAQGTLAPDEALTLPELAPGAYRVQTVGLRSGRVRAYEVTVSPSAAKKLTLSLELGVVLVENLSKETVEVSIDGELYGRVEGGRIAAYGKVPPGSREVTLDFLRSRRTQRIALDLREGQRARVTAHPPQGLIVVENASGEPIQVKIDDAVVARLGADSGTTFVNAPAGARHVRVERMESRTELGLSLDVMADQAIHLPIPSRHVTLVVVNRTELTLALTSDDGELLTVSPRSSEMLLGLRPGEVRLVARGADGAITHEERRVLRAGETAAWVLD